MIVDVQQFITAYLIADAAVYALTAKRITADVLDKHTLYPAVRHNIISTLEDTALDGTPIDLHSRVQVDCYALERHQANALCKAVRDRLRGFRGVFQGFRVSGITLLDSQRNQFIEPKARAEGIRLAIQDFRISYQP